LPSPFVGEHQQTMEASMKWGLLWLLGIPIPVLILLYFLF
jgi:hypothetical protein